MCKTKIKPPIENGCIAESQWKKFSEVQLIEFLEREHFICPHVLTFMVEDLGDITPQTLQVQDRIETILSRYTLHLQRVVREGAIYGLAKLHTKNAKNVIERIAKEDSSPLVREIAQETLLNWDLV